MNPRLFATVLPRVLASQTGEAAVEHLDEQFRAALAHVRDAELVRQL